MIKLNITGTLGRFGYSGIPGSIALDILNIATEQAYKTAYQKAPVDTGTLRDALDYKLATDARMIGEVWVRLPYANIAEYGSKSRLAHPYMRPASKSAQQKMKATIRKAAREAIAEEKARSKDGDS